MAAHKLERPAVARTGQVLHHAALGRPVRVVCVGHASLDHVFEIEAFSAMASKTPARSYRMLAGGMAFNAAVAAARLGAQVRLISRVGSDIAADFLRQRLEEEGIDAQGVQTVLGAATSVSAIVVDRTGERQIFNHRGDAIAKAHGLDTRQLEGADVVLADPRWVGGAAAALSWARNNKVLSVLDGDVAPRADLQRLVALAQWAVFSEPGLATWAPGLAREGALRHACASGASAAMVTCGEAGSWLCSSPTALLVHTGAPEVAAIDTTAAGDVFHGALALALAEGLVAQEAISWASAAAAFKCQRGLGALGAPTRAELARWMQTRSTTPASAQ